MRSVDSFVANGGEGLFETQCIPTDTDLLAVSAYKKFLEERRRRISERLNEYLGTTSV
jgi:hypothetical protein